MVKSLTATAAALGALLMLADLPGAAAPAHDRFVRPSAPGVPGASVGAPAPADLSPQALTGVVQRYCLVCHNDQLLTGNLSLQGFDVAAADARAETAEKMIRKLRAGMMPPPRTPRPGDDTLLALAETLERVVDRAAARDPNPGVRLFQRLNRPEYGRAVRELLALEVEPGDWLPLDTKSANFDNIADAQALSPTLLEAYLNAASDISRLAVGDRHAPALGRTYTNSPYVSQHPWDHVEGAPFGTRGGMVVSHVFLADGSYTFEMNFYGGDGRLEDLDVSIDGERVALLAYSRAGAGADGRGAAGLRTEPVHVRGGQHRVSVAFVRKFEGPYEDLMRPHDWSNAGGGAGGAAITNLPHLRDLVITGPFDPTGLSESPSRRKIFSCRPLSAIEARPCARSIVERLGRDAYRRPLRPDEADGLLSFYDRGAEEGGFEIGVRTALEAILASPFFVFRMEREPSGAAPGESYDLGDVELASRLSFFLWGTPPDEELLALAARGGLAGEKELERQTRRMLADPRSEALATRFAAQWLRLQDLYKVRGDPNVFPNFDDNVARAMQRETELFFDHLVREDRSVLELFTADYTFVDERLARHYDLPDVAGSQFRRVPVPAERRGILGHGSVLVLTSLAIRTSPVLRGKWVMEVLLGTPPPPPPPGVPDLEQTAGAKDGRFLTTRERMEMHRKSPTCSACHQFMDPIGLALDNFDVTGQWRVRENGAPLDTRGVFYDGTPIATPGELADVLMKRPVPLVRNFTQNLLAYALGRRVEYYDQPTVRRIAANAERNDYRISSFVLGVVQSEAFRMKSVAPGAATTQDALDR
jgi:hypothetical protein